MDRFVSAVEAAERLGVERSTLYAYVSRGLLERRRGLDGRSSLFSIDDLDQLASRGRRRPLERPSSIDVEVATAITSIGEGDLRYRGMAVPDLARVATFEQVAALLWTGQLGEPSETWQPQRGVTEARDAVARLPRGAAPAWRVATIVTELAVRDPLRHDRAPSAVADLGRHLIAAIVRALHPTRRSAGASTAAQLALALTARPDDALVRTIDRALALLADHELASSTLAVRIAASTWADPYACVLTGLGVLSGPLHGGASRAHHQLLVECEARGVEVVVGEHLRAGEKLPGFGHKIYREDDPRVAPLREMLADFGSPVRWELVDELLALTSGPSHRSPQRRQRARCTVVRRPGCRPTPASSCSPSPASPAGWRMRSRSTARRP